MPIHHASKICSVLAAAVALLLAPLCAQARERVALVIGNSNYRNAPYLSNPRNDASDVADSFERLGFSVTRLTDATFYDLQNALRSFGRAAHDAETAVVYFAGHGVEAGGRNWLIPTDAVLRAANDVEQEAMSLDLVMKVVGEAHFALIILDACRDNPFATSMAQKGAARAMTRGLAPLQPKANILVAYAARDGTTASDGDGRNSPFTAALLKNLETPGLEVELLFRRVRDAVINETRHQQQPFVYGTLTRQAIYLQPPGAQEARPVGHTVPAAASAPAAPAPARQADMTGACDGLAASPRDRDRPASAPGVEAEEMDAVAALSACEAAIEQHPEIGRLYFQQGRAALALKSYKRAYQLLEKASALGSGIAAYTLGIADLQGIGVEKDEAMARPWLKRGVELGNTSAMGVLGLLYSLEPGKVNDAQAYALFRKAADEDPIAMNGLGVFFEKGRQVAVDYAAARSWYEKAAALGNGVAMRNLGSLYERGLGVRKNRTAANRWYNLAVSAEKAHPQAVPQAASK